MKKTTLQSSAKLVGLVWLVWLQVGMVEGDGHVTITNHLEQQLRVHCASGDDSLAYHVLEPNTVYSFSFTPNIWGNTAYRCDFSSDAYGKRTFPVWEGWLWASRHVACHICNWVVTPRGFKCNGEYFYSWRSW